MRKVELRIKDELKYLTIKKLVETNRNKKRFSIKLDFSIRSIDKMIAVYKEKENYMDYYNSERYQ